MQPHAAHRLKTYESSEKGTDEGYQAAEIGHGAGDDVGYNHDAGCAAEPGYPVRWRVGCQVAGAAQDADEEVFGWELHIWEGATFVSWCGWKARISIGWRNGWKTHVGYHCA